MNLIKHMYVHIPFCVKKCTYCDFAIHALGKRDQVHSSTLKDTYVSYLKKEMEYYLSYDKGDPMALRTVYIGGGTPSLLSIKNLETIVASVNSYRQFDRSLEMTIENEPDSTTAQMVKCYKALGVNRLSMGLQSMDDKHLRALNRNHSYKDFEKALGIILGDYSPKQLNVDLLMGIPGDQLESFMSTLEKVKDMGFGHLSLYNLTVEKNTKLYRMIQSNQATMDEDFQTNAYLAAARFLELNGYNQYEVSNYCRRGDSDLRSKHNIMYWEGDIDFFGFGVGASSLINGHRFKRPTTLKAYYSYVDQLMRGELDVLSLGENEQGNLSQHLESVFIGATRTEAGIRLDRLRAIFEKHKRPELFEPFVDQLRRLKLTKLLKIRVSNTHIRVPKKEFIVSDAILTSICVLINDICA